MIKKMLEKISKGMLIANLLFTGVVITPMNTYAEEMQSYSSATRAWSETLPEVVEVKGNTMITISSKFNFMQTQVDTTMHFSGTSSCSTLSTGTCSFYQTTSVDNYCSLNTDNYLVLIYYIKTTVNGSTNYSTYKMIYYHNQLISDFLMN